MKWIKKELSKFAVKFIISELVMVLISTLSYKICCIGLNKNIVSIISIIISLICNYFLCLKYVFERKNNVNLLIKFTLFEALVIFLKKFIINKLYNSLLVPLFLAKLIGLIFMLAVDYFFKQSLFIENRLISFEKIKQLYSTILKKWNDFINLKYISLIFKFLPQNLFVFIFLIISLYCAGIFFKNNDDMTLYSQNISDGFIPIVDKNITIDFSSYEINQDINKICMVFGTYNRKNTSTIKFELLQDGKESYSREINTSNLKNAKEYCLDVPNINKEKIKDYKLEIIPKNATSNNSIAMFIDKKSNEPTMYLKKTHNNICLKYITIFVLLIAFFIINYVINNVKKLKVTTFLLISLVYFFSFLILNPPLEAPDEPSHFYSEYNLSQNGMSGDRTSEIITPNNIECLNYSKIQFRDRVTNFEEVKSCLKDGKNEKRTIMFGTSQHVSNSFLGHLLSAIAIKITDIFTNSPVIIFYSARIGNFAISFYILYLALKKSQKYKNVILFIGLTPMFVQQITSLSYDAIINSITLLFAAWFINLVSEKRKLKLKDIIIPCVYLILMFTIKMVYVPLALALLFIPKECFKNSKQKFSYYLFIVMIALLGNYFIGNVIINKIPVTSNITNSNFAYIMKDPLQLITIIINTFKINGWFYIKSMVGYFSWFKYSLSDFTILCWLICFVLLILSEKSILNNSSNCIKKIKIKKIIFLIGIMISIAGIFASMYLYWSQYGLNYVDGVQGRYFIPLLIFIAIFCSPKRKKLSFDKKILYSFCNIMLFQTIFYLLTYFY